MTTAIDRVMTSQIVQLNSITIPRSVLEFGEPKYTPVYEDIEGTLIPEPIVVAYERVEGNVQIKGVGAKVAYEAIKKGRDNVIIFSEKGSENGQRYDKEHTITAHVKAEFSPSKVKERQTLTLTYIVNKHTLVDAGETVIDVDIKNGRYKIYGEEFNV
ncbi:hypothetical protein G6Z94_11775 [Vibrio aestuarianus]|uniref:phage major tail tube protein n=1 Tax=Vibrio aestuarianus TaxID=28171 RepID=UPI0015938472|nr:phage major tail tube protein [Vibrio aestuarianus]NGZ18018.1 hypothetical protein [Vibrio aestuarianus]